MKPSKTYKNLHNSKLYNSLNKIIIATNVLFVTVYIFRDNLYMLDNQYIRLFAETVPNLIPSFLFTLIGTFYVLPVLEVDVINKSLYIWLINLLNIIIFSLIEYLHVLLDLGSWDNNDIFASLVGIIFATVYYFIARRKLCNTK